MVLYPVDVVHDDLWPQIEGATDLGQVRAARMPLAEMPLHNKPVLADLVERREGMVLHRPHDVTALVRIPAAVPACWPYAVHRVQFAAAALADPLASLC